MSAKKLHCFFVQIEKCYSWVSCSRCLKELCTHLCWNGLQHSQPHVSHVSHFSQKKELEVLKINILSGRQKSFTAATIGYILTFDKAYINTWWGLVKLSTKITYATTSHQNKDDDNNKSNVFHFHSICRYLWGE